MTAPAALLGAFEEPLLLLDGVTVTAANPAAHALFGEQLAGRDARLVLRHPAALALLAGEGAGPVAIGGLGDPERRWEMRVRGIGGGCRLVRLEDRSVALAAERVRTDFVANASHELRTPLAALAGFIETLEAANGPADAATRLRFLAIMGGEARRMQRLIDDLMSLSRIEVDRFVPPRTRIDLRDVVATACAELAAGHAGGGRVRCAPDGEPLAVAGDVAQLSQLVHNVVGNALKYGDQAAPVDVRVARVGNAAHLIVADRGEGIAPELVPRLTERFFRIDPGRSRQLGGTGLGLAIVKHIVERHRGRLDIASVPGRGTTVTVALPLAGEPL